MWKFGLVGFVMIIRQLPSESEIQPQPRIYNCQKEWRESERFRMMEKAASRMARIGENYDSICSTNIALKVSPSSFDSVRVTYGGRGTVTI
jgi:hypothetical protein